ncbi:MAG: Hsp20/alpha crystallin family protein [Phycisphaerales bacterium]
MLTFRPMNRNNASGFNRPMSSLDALSREIERVFDTVANPSFPAGVGRAVQYPAINAWQADDHFVIESELPGLSIDEIEIFVEEQRITLRGRRERLNQEGVELIRAERWSGEFDRTITLPKPFDAESTEATLENGILTIKAPFHESTRPRKIEVRSGGINQDSEAN